jgi:hypothetical protein
MGHLRNIYGLMMVQLVTCCVASLCITIAYAEERRDYVLLSDDAYAALQCSVFAAHARYNADETRLFSYGLEKARLFIQAARAGQVSADDFAHTNFVWPLALRAWNFQPQDTSTDFVAGTVYEMIWTNTTGDLGNRSHDQATYQEPARAEYASHNCSLLGR